MEINVFILKSLKRRRWPRNLTSDLRFNHFLVFFRHFLQDQTCRTRHWTFLAHVQLFLEGVPFKKTIQFHKLFILSRICNINFIKYVWARILNVFSQKNLVIWNCAFIFLSETWLQIESDIITWICGVFNKVSRLKFWNIVK